MPLPPTGVCDEGGVEPIWEEAHPEHCFSRRDGARPQAVPTQRGRGQWPVDAPIASRLVAGAVRDQSSVLLQMRVINEGWGL